MLKIKDAHKYIGQEVMTERQGKVRIGTLERIGLLLHVKHPDVIHPVAYVPSEVTPTPEGD